MKQWIIIYKGRLGIWQVTPTPMLDIHSTEMLVHMYRVGGFDAEHREVDIPHHSENRPSAIKK